MDERLNNNLTILVNSCDSYSDLWPPFFALLKKYWNTSGVRIILNTETKDFSFDGLTIECVHCPNSPYGGRIIHALKQVKTKYVINMLDDFFLRKPVDNCCVNRLVDWMDNDDRIAYFSFDPYVTEYDLSCPYEGFSQICPGTNYTLTLQLAIWRTERFRSYWMKNITPWEWEVFTDIKSCWHTNDRFFRERYPHIFDYGYYKTGRWMGVQRGKWVMEDVVPLFEKEGITVDYDARNNRASIKPFNTSPPPSKLFICRQFQKYKEVTRLLGLEGAVHRFAFDCKRKVFKLSGRHMNKDFYAYTREKARERYQRRRKLQPF